MTTTLSTSKPNTLAKLDGRTREAALMRRTRQELTDHVGGRPSTTERALIERAVALTLRLAVMDRQFAETGHQNDHSSRVYLAWSNTLTRTMRQLGLQPAPKLRGLRAGIVNDEMNKRWALPAVDCPVPGYQDPEWRNPPPAWHSAYSELRIDAATPLPSLLAVR